MKPILVHFPFSVILCALIFIFQYNFGSASHGVPCNIPRVSSDKGIDWQSLESPVIFLRTRHAKATVQSRTLRGLGSKQHILTKLGNELVNVTSPEKNTGKWVSMTIEKYMTNHVDALASTAVNPTPESISRAKSLYLFGFNGNTFQSTVTPYSLPEPCKGCNNDYLKSVGIAGRNSGVSWHSHGAVFSETILGIKRWFLLHPSASRSAHGLDLNLTMTEWLNSEYPNIYQNLPQIQQPQQPQQSQQQSEILPFYECAVSFGEILYIPKQWLHATYNLNDYNFFVSTFVFDDSSDASVSTTQKNIPSRHLR